MNTSNIYPCKSSMISPILDFPQNSYANDMSNRLFGSPMPITRQGNHDESGKKGTKRSVSETKKICSFQTSRKYSGCSEQLNAWFEVDHVIRLEHGYVDNLVALCRECPVRKRQLRICKIIFFVLSLLGCGFVKPSKRKYNCTFIYFI